MVIFPPCFIGLYTCYSRGSLIDVPSIEKLSLSLGIKSVGVCDKIPSLWISEILHSPKGAVKVFAAPERTLSLEGHKIKIYVTPNDLESFIALSNNSFLLDVSLLKNFNFTIFYAGNDHKIFETLYDIFTYRLGISLQNNFSVIEKYLKRIDLIVPFHFSNVPPSLKEYKTQILNILGKISFFPDALEIISKVDKIPEEIIAKIIYTQDYLRDVRDIFKETSRSREETYSSLLWNLITSKGKPDEEVRKEFFHISKLGLSEFFYKFILSIQEYSKDYLIDLPLLSTSRILKTLRLSKVNRTRGRYLFRFLLDNLPLYVRINLYGNKDIFLKLLKENFSDTLFHRVYPVHLSEKKVKIISQRISESNPQALEKHLRSLVESYRVSNNLFFSNTLIKQKILERSNFDLVAIGKYYDVVLDIKSSKYDLIFFRSGKTNDTIDVSRFFDIVKNDRFFITPEISSFWYDNMRKTFDFKGFNGLFRYFYLSYVISRKPYLKSLVEELIELKGTPFFEDILPKDTDEEVIKLLFSVVTSKDKYEYSIREVDFFNLLLNTNIGKDISTAISDFVNRFRNIIGIKSFEISSFYNFLYLISLRIRDLESFVSLIFEESLEKHYNSTLVMVNHFYKLGFLFLQHDINESGFKKVLVRNDKIILPFSVAKVSKNFVSEIFGERKHKPFENFYDFYKRVGNRYPLETSRLVKCGFFDNYDSREKLTKFIEFSDKASKDLYFIREELKITKLPLHIYRSDFSSYREKANVGTISDLKKLNSFSFLGVVVFVDKFGNIVVEDETNIVYIRNKIFQSIKVGDFGIFEVSLGKSGILGYDFILKFFEKML